MKKQYLYLINTTLGFSLIEAKSPIDALTDYWTRRSEHKEIILKDYFLSREDLLSKGFSIIKTTSEARVFLIK